MQFQLLSWFARHEYLLTTVRKTGIKHCVHFFYLVRFLKHWIFEESKKKSFGSPRFVHHTVQMHFLFTNKRLIVSFGAISCSQPFTSSSRYCFETLGPNIGLGMCLYSTNWSTTVAFTFSRHRQRHHIHPVNTIYRWISFIDLVLFPFLLQPLPFCLYETFGLFDAFTQLKRTTQRDFQNQSIVLNCIQIKCASKLSLSRSLYFSIDPFFLIRFFSLSFFTRFSRVSVRPLRRQHRLETSKILFFCIFLII